VINASREVYTTLTCVTGSYVGTESVCTTKSFPNRECGLNELTANTIQRNKSETKQKNEHNMFLITKMIRDVVAVELFKMAQFDNIL